MGRFEDFTKFRQEMNRKILGQGTLEIKRFFGARAAVEMATVWN